MKTEKTLADLQVGDPVFSRGGGIVGHLDRRHGVAFVFNLDGAQKGFKITLQSETADKTRFKVSARVYGLIGAVAHTPKTFYLNDPHEDTCRTGDSVLAV